MAVRPIVKWPDPRLRQETNAVPEITDEIRELYRDLCDTMFADNGVGIAAIQIGHPTKMFLIEATLAGGSQDDPPLAFINPEIELVGDVLETADEGCLSFPGIYVPIERSYKARARAMNMAGEIFEVEGEGLYARALQHENDHLTGRLLVDFVGPLKRQMIKRKMKRLVAEQETGGDEAARG
jgi:peptide deformylase